MKRAVLVLVLLAAVGVAIYGAVRRFGGRQAPGTSGTLAENSDGLPLLQTPYDPVPPRRGPDPTPAAPVAPPALAQAGPAAVPPEAAGRDASLDELDALAKSGDVTKMIEARAALTKRILATPDDGPARAALRQRLDAVNAKLFFSPLSTPDSVVHTVGQGEALWTIKNKYRTSVELLQRVNNLSSDVIRPGQTLKIPRGEFSVRVDRARFRLIVLLNGHYIKEYRVGIGKDDLTPAGEFEVGSMAKNPSWTDPNGKVHAFGDPENPLGTRWIGFKPAYGRSGLGIHGTTEEASIGTKCSSGCIRLLNADVEELYGMLNLGDKVLVE